MKQHIQKSLQWLSGIGICALFVGCAAVPAPNYSPLIDNVELLKKSSVGTLKTGQFDVTPGMQGASAMTLRGATMISPVGTHYGDYLTSALRQELEFAKLQNPQSKKEISGVLLKNNIDAGGLSTNAGQIEARFMVKNADQVTYDKVKKAELQWESSFAGAVAIPQAVNHYPLMVQKLLNSLFTDPDFILATQK